MKLSVFIIFSALIIFVSAQYTVNVDEILNNKRLLEAYSKCYLDKGPCPAAAREGKKNIREVLLTNCGKCDKKQREDTRIAFRKLRSAKPQLFLEIFEKYDPGKKHLNSFLNWLKKND